MKFELPERHSGDGHATAIAAGLNYVSDADPGISRGGAGRGFVYRSPDGDVVRDPEALRRIRALAIPPAYTGVWISADPLGHLQATGIDTRGRKQYRYHPLFRAARDEAKFRRMVEFGRALPLIRRRVSTDLSSSKLGRDRVVAAVVRLLETTRIRVGNEEYSRQNQSFGLTTLCSEHLDVDCSTLHFHFRGKSGKEWRADLHDRRLARIVRRLQDLPGQELFRYLDESATPHTVTSCDVNAYLKATSGGSFTAKDFRTWAGTVLAMRGLNEHGPATSPTAAKRVITSVVKSVAAQLGNTPAVCRKSYIDPAILEGYANGTLTAVPATEDADPGPPDLSPEETAVLRYLAQVKR